MASEVVVEVMELSEHLAAAIELALQDFPLSDGLGVVELVHRVVGSCWSESLVVILLQPFEIFIVVKLVSWNHHYKVYIQRDVLGNLVVFDLGPSNGMVASGRVTLN